MIYVLNLAGESFGSSSQYLTKSLKWSMIKSDIFMRISNLILFGVPFTLPPTFGAPFGLAIYSL
nr:MAG TPA: hypothetical protein [Caudoviricetes sp.]